VDDLSPSDLKAILHSKRANLYYLEHCRVLVKGGRVEYVTDQGKQSLYWNIPIANTTSLLLGTGTSITQAAMRELAKAGVLVGFCGGSPLFSAPSTSIPGQFSTSRAGQFSTRPNIRKIQAGSPGTGIRGLAFGRNPAEAHQCQGSTSAIPQSSKSRVLRVARVAPSERTMPAIIRSDWLDGRPTARRRAAISACASAAASS
jgi:hypothetical protein